MNSKEFENLSNEYPELSNLPIIDGGKLPEYFPIFEEKVGDIQVYYYRIDHHFLKWAIGKIAIHMGQGYIFPFDTLKEARNYARK